jgi:hypothetical protein
MTINVTIAGEVIPITLDKIEVVVHSCDTIQTIPILNTETFLITIEERKPSESKT